MLLHVPFALLFTTGAALAVEPAATTSCLDLPPRREELAAALGELTIATPGEERPIKDARIVNAGGSIAEAKLWDLLGGKPQALGAEQAAMTVAALVRSGLFERITPTIRLPPGTTGAVLEIAVVEHPVVRRVVVEGAADELAGALVERLVVAPDGERQPGDCPVHDPPRSWVAHVEDGVLVPGPLWRGPRVAIGRAAKWLFDGGYQMASVRADLGADGTLTLRVDQGRIEAVELRGVAEPLREPVRARLGLAPGRPFVASDLDDALARVRERYPFLAPRPARRPTRRPPDVIEEVLPDGGRRYHGVEAGPEPKETWYVVENHTVTLHLRNRAGRFDVSGADLIRHTPVTGFGPGLMLEGELWDREDRAHLIVDGLVRVNPNGRRAHPTDARGGYWEGAAGPRIAIPRARIAELGFQAHDFADTEDRWRIDAVDSYIYSILINRPDSEYFRRRGLSAFVTAHLFERLTAGVEYRADRYESIASFGRVFTIFNRDEAAPLNPPVDEGRMTSVIARLEWSSTPVPASRVGGLLRDPARSIVDLFHQGVAHPWAIVHTMNTVEIADHALGGGDFGFVKLVTDSGVFVPTTRRQGLALRVRAAGRLGGDLPRQREEALGGWTALRGYGFKELRDGTWSVLGTAEYRLWVISPFVDVGSVRQATGWTQAKAGVGVALNLGKEAQLAFGWRTDDQAHLAPEVRLMFNRTY